MPRIFLHIGDYKTGSTAIQQTLGRNRPALAAGGLIYPGSEDDHRAVAYALRDMPGGAAAPSIRDETLAAKGVVLSSEGFASVDPERMRAWCGDADVTVIVYLREQAESIASRYQQEVKSGRLTERFETFAAAVIDYSHFLAPWARAFGASSLRARAYSSDVVGDFLRLLGLDAAKFALPPADPNPSIAGPLLEAKRRINALYAVSDETLLDLTWSALNALANENPRYRGRVSATPEVVEAIRHKHRPRNSALAEKYGVSLPERDWPDVPPFTERDVRRAFDDLGRRSPELDRLPGFLFLRP